MADIFVRAKWLGQDVKRGVQDLTQQVGGLKLELGAVGKVANAALGIGGLLTVATQLRSGFMSVSDEFRIQQRLLQVMRKESVAWAQDMKAAQAEVSRLQGRPFADDELLSALERMIRLTHDAQGSIANLSLVADVAVGAKLDLERAAKVVAFAMKGEGDQVARLAPELKGLVRDLSDLRGSSDAAAQIVKGLNDTFRDAAQGETSGLSILRSGLGELRDSIIELVTGESGADSLLRKIGDAAKYDADQVRALRQEWESFASGVGGLLMGNPQGFKDWLAQMAGFDSSGDFSRSRTVAQFGKARGSQGDGVVRGNLDDPRYKHLWDMGPFMGPREGGPADPMPDFWWRMSPSEIAALRRRQLGRSGGIMGDRTTRGLDFFGPTYGTRFGYGMGDMQMLYGRRQQDDMPPAQKRWQEERKEMKKFAAEMGDTVGGALRAGLEGGYEGFLDYMKNKGIGFLESLFAGVATIAFGGTPTGIAGLILGGGRGGAAATGTIQAARQRAAMVQAMRLRQGRG